MSMAVKRKHPKFLRPNFGRSSRSRIKKAWRRQRGIDNKKRLKIAYMGASPSIGYGQPSEIRGRFKSAVFHKKVRDPLVRQFLFLRHVHPSFLFRMLNSIHPTIS